MKKMFVLISHGLTQEQKSQALKVFGVENIINIADDAWSNISPSDENILYVLNRYKKELVLEAEAGDILLVQGDFGATYNMINFAKNIGIKTIYATTKRMVQELVIDGKTIIKRKFKHEKFREYL
ncbi:CRISPR-associated protein Csx20 [Campylobacter concisus]|uniref:CRISPR-associated protein Csx20 n=1 Tax=Campylobacter concisus TaxID=199 RepID=UPI00122CED2D|nr:CRISPR-associated protein Csx20 [Campylobacter concisus]